MISWYIDSSCMLSSLRRVLRHGSEELLGGANSLSERVDVVVAGVHVEGRPRGGRHAVPADHRPGAVVPDPDGDAQVVEHLADVVRVDALDRERDRSPAG